LVVISIYQLILAKDRLFGLIGKSKTGRPALANRPVFYLEQLGLNQHYSQHHARNH
jgi:hypothetical protein